MLILKVQKVLRACHNFQKLLETDLYQLVFSASIDIRSKVLHEYDIEIYSNPG